MKYDGSYNGIKRQVVDYILQNRDEEYFDILLEKPYGEEHKPWDECTKKDIDVFGQDLLGAIIGWHVITETLEDFGESHRAKAHQQLDAIFDGLYEKTIEATEAKLERLKSKVASKEEREIA